MICNVKRIFAVLLALAMMLGLLPTLAFAQPTDGTAPAQTEVSTAASDLPPSANNSLKPFAPADSIEPDDDNDIVGGGHTVNRKPEDLAVVGNNTGNYTANALDASPYPLVQYPYSAGTSVGTIRYISQVDKSSYYNSAYWPTAPFGNYAGPGSECGTSCISMSLSYIGINKTPKDILEAHNGHTYFGDNWGGATALNLTNNLSGAINNYLNGNGKYSPPIIHLNKDVYSANGHFVVIAGRRADGTYAILDPARNAVGTMTISGNTWSYNGKSGTTDQVNQYYNANAVMPTEPEPDPDPVASSLSIEPTVWPQGTIPKAVFNLKGNVYSNYYITEFKGEIISSSGDVVQTVSIAPNAYSVSIYGSYVNQKLKFGDLENGAYKIRYFARDASYNEVVWDSYEHDGDWFYVGTSGSNPDPQEDTITLSGAVMPLYFYVGDHFSISGTISSNVSNLTNVTVEILNNSDDTEYELSMSTHSSTYTLDSIASNIPFESLSTGTYYFRVSASNSSGTKVLYYSDFEVLALIIIDPTPEDPDPEEPVDSDQLTLSGVNYPSELVIGSPYIIGGTVLSGTSNISSVTVGIFTEAGEPVSIQTRTPDATSFDISLVDQGVQFGSVPSGGVYYYQIIASNASHENEVLLNKPFLVTDSIRVDYPQYPSGVLIMNNPFELWGTLVSSSNLTHVVVGIYKLTGEAWHEEEFWINTKQWSIHSNADKLFRFSSIPSGSYYYRVTFTNATFVDKVIIESKFYVKNNSHTHSLTRHVAYEPTCTVAGNIEYWQCSSCNQIHSNAAGTDEILLSETVIPPTPHSYNYEVVVAPTEESEGMIRGTCSVCGDITENWIGMLNSTSYYYEVVTPATCTTSGVASYTWKAINFGGSYVFYTEISPTGHDFSYQLTTEPTLTSTGMLTGTCSRCDVIDHITLPQLNTTDYDYTETVPVTCTTDGLARYTWKNTDYGTYTFERVLPKGHIYVGVILAPSCTENGYTTYTCSRCGNSYTDDQIPALGHSFGPWTQTSTATCTEPGYITRTCSRCNAVESIELPATGHNFQLDRTVEPSCTEQGGTVYKCSRCGQEELRDSVAALGHSYSATVTAPTCTEKGYTTYTCSRCGDSYTGNQTAALGHLPGQPVMENHTPPTPTADGGYDIVIYCDRCYAELSRYHYILPATGSEEPVDPIETDALHVYSSISVGTDMVISLTARKNDLTNYNKFWIEVVKHEAEGDKTFRYGEDQPDGELTEGSTTWGTRFTNIFAKEMGVDIEVRLYAQNDQGQIYMSPVRSINIRDYLGGRLTATNNKVEQRVLAADMLNYGAAAQMFTGFQTDHLVNEELTADQLAKLHEYETTELPLVEKTNYNTRPEGQSNILFTSVTLGNEVLLNLTVRLAEGTEGVQVLVKNHATGAVVTTLDTTFLGSTFNATFNGIGADAMRTEFDLVTIVNGVETGNIRTWSVEAYVGEIRAEGIALKVAMGNALLTYGDSAAAYFAAQ